MLLIVRRWTKIPFLYKLISIEIFQIELGFEIERVDKGRS